jgi:uncharacterized protein (TIGR02452 family)
VIREEESIFRRSNCYAAVNEKHETLYPLDSGYIYIPKATVFKTETYDRIDKPFGVAFILCPAIRQPALIYVREGGKSVVAYKNDGDSELMREKIFGIFKIAYEKGYSCLLLSALGCGSCLNPIHLVVSYFNEAITKYPIKYVIFAIQGISDPLSPKKDKNYEYFNSHIVRF